MIFNGGGAAGRNALSTWMCPVKVPPSWKTVRINARYGPTDYSAIVASRKEQDRHRVAVQ